MTKREPPGGRLKLILSIFPLLWFLVLLTGPLLYLFALSFSQRGLYGGIEWSLSFENFQRIFDPLYFWIFMRSLGLASLTALICLIFAVPSAWAIASLPRKWRFGVLIFFVLPFVVNMISRIYAIRSVFAFDGPLASLLRQFGLGEVATEALSQNIVVVAIGMVSTYLPFMFFPIYVALEKFDFSQVEAALDLGSSPTMAFWKVVMPQIRPAVASGLIMVFVPCLGEFVIPDLLGGARVMLAGSFVTEQFLKARDWPFGAAFSVLMILQMCFFIWLINYWGRSALSKSERKL